MSKHESAKIAFSQSPKLESLGPPTQSHVADLPSKTIGPDGQLDYTRRGRWPARAQFIYENSSSGVGYNAYNYVNLLRESKETDGGKLKHYNQCHEIVCELYNVSETS